MWKNPAFSPLMRDGHPRWPLLAAGLCLSYLLLPLVHHLLATPPGYRYISAASNFFAFSPPLQLAVFAVTAGLAVVVTRLRKRSLPA